MGDEILPATGLQSQATCTLAGFFSGMKSMARSEETHVRLIIGVMVSHGKRKNRQPRRLNKMQKPGQAD